MIRISGNPVKLNDKNCILIKIKVMKNLVTFLLAVFFISTNLYGQDKSQWLDYSYLQVDGGYKYNQPVRMYDEVANVGYFLNANKLVLGLSSNFTFFPNRFGGLKLGAKIHVGKFLKRPNQQNWNILLSSGLGYHQAFSIRTNTRTGTDPDGNPIWDSKTRGGNSLILPLAVELHTNNISKHGMVVKFEMLVDKQLSLYYNATIGLNISTTKS